MASSDFVKKIGPLAHADMLKSGILASIIAAQAILESGYGTTELAQNANNYFGMKCSLSGNTWATVWDGTSTYTKKTAEQNPDGSIYYVTADFRKYPNIETSIADHSLYLAGAKNGSELRYEGLIGETDPKKAAQIIKCGGYATDISYVDKLCNLIDRYDLTQYDEKEESNLKINQNTNFGTHNTSKRTGAIKYIVLHYVGATGDAKNNVNYYNQRTTTSASADFFVGHSGDIWQYNPDPKSRYCWAVGGGKQSSYGGSLYGKAKNANSVSIEMCVKTKGSQAANSPDWYFTDETIASAVKLTKYLMNLYGIPASRVIRHFDVNGKFCPGVVGWNSATRSESAWNSFKSKISGGSSSSQTSTSGTMYRVRKTWADAKSQVGAYTVLSNAKKKADETGLNVYDASGNCVYSPSGSGSGGGTSFKVRVKISDLYIRKGPGTSYGKNGFCPVGVYTIVKTKSANGYTWGRLKSGAGWIALEYTERL